MNERDRTAAGRYIQPHAECNVLAPFATAPLGATEVPLQLGQLTRVYARARVWVAWGTVRILAWGTVRVLHGVLHGVLSGCCMGYCPGAAGWSGSWAITGRWGLGSDGVWLAYAGTAAFACALQPRRDDLSLHAHRHRQEPRLRRCHCCLCRCLSACLPVGVDVCVRTDVRLQTGPVPVRTNMS